jgi:hypothetical protein
VQTPPGSQDLHEEALGLDLRQMEGLERALPLPPYGFLAVEGPPAQARRRQSPRWRATAGGKVLTMSLINVAVDTAIERILAEDLRSGNRPQNKSPSQDEPREGLGPSRRSKLRRQRAISSTVRGVSQRRDPKHTPRSCGTLPPQ